MTHEDYVSFEQAKALKELGFDWECNHYYNDNELVENTEKCFTSYDDFNNDDYIETCYSAPTLSQTQKWLREKHYLSVEVYSSLDIDSNWEWDSFVKNLNNILEEDIEDSTISYQTYEEALLAGINKALELLKEEGNGNQD